MTAQGDTGAADTLTHSREPTRAACATADPRHFDVDASVPDQVTAARTYCAGCPIRLACETKARTERLCGLWGGWHFPETGRTARRYYDRPLAEARRDWRSRTDWRVA